MFKLLHFIIFTLIAVQCSVAQNFEQIVVGSKHTLYSEVLNEDREYWVSLPEDYDLKSNNYKRYPLLVLLDGHAHFRSISGMVNYMSSGYNGNRRIPEMIVVAIKNVNRSRDYTPDKIVTKRKNDYGGGEVFLSFLEEELIPYVDANFRTTPYRIMFGHSLGGLLATHTYMKEQTLFNAFIAVDPSFGSWDESVMDEKLARVTENSFKRYIYMATANWGDRTARNKDRHERLFKALSTLCKKKFPAEIEYFENEDHGSVPAIAFHNGITSIFRGYGINYRDVKDIDQLQAHFQSLSDRLTWTILPPENLVNRLGYRRLGGRNIEDLAKAIAFFQLNTRNFPESYNAFDSLGEAYEASGDNINAIKNYKKSLELNPNNGHAAAKIESLRID